MAQPTWVTAAGSLGTYLPGKYLHVTLFAKPANVGSEVKYKLLNGSLPSGITLKSRNEVGIIDGTPTLIPDDVTFTFTVRAYDAFGLISDRTFSLKILGSLQPSFTTRAGNILTVNDSTWVEFQLQYTQAAVASSTNITLNTGILPPGLEITNLGVIKGYAKPPITDIRNPTTKTYSFTVKLENDLGVATRTFSITVLNQELKKAAHTRVPTILNNRPLSLITSMDDKYYGYYSPDNVIPTVVSGSNFNFKVIGYDFENDPIIYEFIDLPPGLTGYPLTGWISGTPTLGSTGLSDYDFSVRVKKIFKPSIVSNITKFKLRVIKNISTVINWLSPANLGSINNNTISDLSIVATSSHALNYRLVSGSLPPNLILLQTGELAGKVANQPKSTLTPVGSSNTFTFEVEAYSKLFPALTGRRIFTLKVNQYYAVPTETMYFKATPNLNDRAIIRDLLNNDNLIPYNYLYRPEDNNFGKASDVKFVQVYGINSSTIEKYISAINQNHYWRQITLGNLKTAVARDDNGNIIYEVVYSEIVDNLVNNNGKSVAKDITLPKVIDISAGENIDSRTDIYTSYEIDLNANISYYDSASSNLIKHVYPASFDNMRKQIASVLSENYDSKLLPKWMSSQQLSGSILGFQSAWVICYTKPGYSETIKNNINKNWAHKLNEIYFLIDRYVVDKSSTFDYNDYLSTPSWENLPSASPTPDPIDSHDFYVLFPRKTILPK
jgi:Putative Ig domain